MAEIGVAYVQLVPSWNAAKMAEALGVAKEAMSKVKPPPPPVSPVKRYGEAIRTHMGSAFSTVGKIGVAAIGAVAAGVAGLAVKGGLDRALALNNARAKMQGLGMDSKQVSQVMGNVQTAVKGTAYSMGDAAKVAALFATSGIKGGKDMENSLKAVTNVAAVSGRSMQDIGVIFSQVKAKGKLMGDDIMQLANSGVPALSLVAKHLGVTEQQAQKMAQKGKISFEQFSEAMRVELGESAQAVAKTAGGAWANLKTAIGKTTTGFWQPLIDSSAPVMIQLQGVVEKFTEKLKPLQDAFAGAIKKKMDAFAKSIERIKNKFAGLKPPDLSELKSVFAGLLPIVGGLVGKFSGLASNLPIVGRLLTGLTGPAGAIIGIFFALWNSSDEFRKGVKRLIGALVKVATKVLPVFAVAAGAVGKALKPVADALGKVLQWLTPFVPEIVAAVVAFKGFNKAVDGVKNIVTALRGIPAVVSGIRAALMALATSNPLGWVALAVAAAVAAITYLWTHSEKFRDAVKAVWEHIKKAAEAVANWFTNTLVPKLSAVWDTICEGASKIVQGFSNTWDELCQDGQAISDWFTNNIVTPLSTAWETVKQAVSDAWNFITGTIQAGIDFISGIINSGLAIVKSIWSTVWGAIKSAASTIWETIKNVIQTCIQFVVTVITTYLNVAKTVWSTVWNGIKAFALSVWNGIKTVVQTAINAVSGVIRSTLSAIKSVWSSIWNAVSSIVRSVWGRIKSTVSSAVNGVISVVRSIGGKVKSVMSNAGQWLVSAGKAIIRGLINGIKSMFGKVKGALNWLTSKLKDWKGPERVDRELLHGAGRLVIGGFVDGLESKFGAVRDSLGGLTRSLPGMIGDPNVMRKQAEKIMSIKERMANREAELRRHLHEIEMRNLDIRRRVEAQLAAIKSRGQEELARRVGMFDRAFTEPFTNGLSSTRVAAGLRPVEVHQHIAVAEVPKTSALASKGAVEARLWAVAGGVM